MAGEEARPVVIFIGAPGSGKTKIGRRVAKLLGVTFVDSDKRIVAEHGDIADIFTQHGEPYFRELERATISEALRERVVLSVGGGAVMHPETRAEFAQHRIVQLTVSAEAVESRITGGKRPLLSSGLDAWRTLVDKRSSVYNELATRSWDTSSRPIDSIAADIAEWVADEADIPLAAQRTTTDGNEAR
ncbi:shikimate kinase [Salinibacterium hongtaonis]|uniref:shikimate kinase n=1 Tax=Homoserinimonas hongtaonis TaxID=2079791 RepID=UPI000D39B5AF|nr:shikimate kinase [Salinibacterium hongtaonis]AWB89287.1 shikimate kinase [Salinibacterium hongtaonis]